MGEVKKVLTVPQLAKEYGIPCYSIRKCISDGRLGVLRMGNKLYVKISDFENLFTTEGERHGFDD